MAVRNRKHNRKHLQQNVLLRCGEDFQQIFQSDEVICQIKAVTDPLTWQLERFCELMQELKNERTSRRHKKLPPSQLLTPQGSGLESENLQLIFLSQLKHIFDRKTFFRRKTAIVFRFGFMLNEIFCFLSIDLCRCFKMKCLGFPALCSPNNLD